MPAMPSSIASAKPTGPPPAMRTGIISLLTPLSCRYQDGDLLGDAGSLLRSFEFDRRFGGDARTLLHILDRLKLEAGADALAARYRIGEAHLVAAVIEPRCELLDPVRLLAQPCEQGQGQEPMCDRATKG